MAIIQTKCIKASKEDSDGIRISVMSSHTLNDGVTVDESIESSMYHMHIPQLAAPRKLLGDYYKHGLSWDEYEKRYLEYIRTPEITDMLIELVSNHPKLTFLCIEDTDEKCHRRLLMEECNRLQRQISMREFSNCNTLSMYELDALKQTITNALKKLPPWDMNIEIANALFALHVQAKYATELEMERVHISNMTHD